MPLPYGQVPLSVRPDEVRLYDPTSPANRGKRTLTRLPRDKLDGKYTYQLLLQTCKLRGIAMAENKGNQTPNTPDVSETELREMKVDELRQEARDEEISGASGMRKEELVKEVAKAKSGNDAGDRGSGDPDSDADDLGAGPEGGKIRRGPDSSKSLKYSQEVTSTEDEPEREGRSLATTHHEVIRQWAEERDGVPATVEGTEHGDHLGVLQIDFGGDNANLRHVSWEEWFATFDERGLNFIYRNSAATGSSPTFSGWRTRSAKTPDQRRALPGRAWPGSQNHPCRPPPTVL